MPIIGRNKAVHAFPAAMKPVFQISFIFILPHSSSVSHKMTYVFNGESDLLVIWWNVFALDMTIPVDWVFVFIYAVKWRVRVKRQPLGFEEGMGGIFLKISSISLSVVFRWVYVAPVCTRARFSVAVLPFLVAIIFHLLPKNFMYVFFRCFAFVNQK